MQAGLGPTNDPRQEAQRPQLFGSGLFRSGDAGIGALIEEPLNDEVTP